MKFSTRELVTIAVFGALWGLVEMSLGTVLKSLRVPMSGLVLSAIGLTLALIGRMYVPRRGSTLFIGTVAMLLKLFSMSSILIGPIIGIMSEALVAEVVLSLGGRPRRLIFLFAGALATFWVLVQPLITNPIFFGRSVAEAWLGLISQGSTLLGLNKAVVGTIVAALVVLHLAVGIAVGWLSWSTGHLLQARMGRSHLSGD